MNADFNGFINKYGLVTMANGDMGDSPMKTSFYYIGQFLTSTDPAFRAALRSKFDQVVQTIQINTGQYVRSPDAPYNKPEDLSRDQTWPLIAAFGILGLTERRDLLINAVLNARDQAQNGDLFGPQELGGFIRLKREAGLWPALWLLDFGHLVNSIIQCFKSLNPDNVGDDMNHCLNLLVAYNSWPTPISWLARKVYFFFRLKSYGSYLQPGFTDEQVESDFNAAIPSHPTNPPVQGAWAWYWRPTSGAPPMDVLWTPILRLLG